MFSSLQKNIVLCLFIGFLILGFSACKPKISPAGRDFLSKVSSDISVLATDITSTMHTQNTSNAVEVICEWVGKTSLSTNEYLAVGLLDSSGTDFFSYDLIECTAFVSEGNSGDYSDYKAMKPLLKGNKFSTGTVYWEGIPYGIVCRVVDSGKTNSGVVILFLSPESIQNADITINQFSNNVL